MNALAPVHVCPAFQGFPKNAWYVAAFSSEVDRTLLQRKLLGQNVVLYRREDGSAVALEDRCPHRGVALSKGNLIGDRIQCGYHGLEFEPSGRCALVPSQDQVPSQMKVAAYPVAEIWPWIWIWMGDADKADPNMIPDHHALGLGREDMKGQVNFMMELKCNYQLLHENLLDTSHITYLHPGAFDTGDSARALYDVELSNGVIRLTRDFPNDMSPLSAGARAYFDGPVNRKLVTETFVPSLNVITNVYYDARQPDRPPEVLISPFGITPRDDRSCYHFVISAQTNATYTPQTDESRERVWQIFCQDRDALEDIQRTFEELGPDATEISVVADQAALRCRRVIAEMVAKEESELR